MVIAIFTIAVYLNRSASTFQHDADISRARDLVYWTQLIEEYKEKKGVYPLQDRITGDEEIILVRIATNDQQRYFDPGAAEYSSSLDMNASGSFNEFTMEQFMSVLESGLDRDILEHYDVQKIPIGSPAWYQYYVQSDGYLMWVTCVTCEVNEFTTLLFDGYTKTINVGSEKIVEGEHKLFLRKELLAKKEFKELIGSEQYKPKYIQSLQIKTYHDSDTY